MTSDFCCRCISEKVMFKHLKEVKENMKKELELYVHIPFCVKKCAYCDFLSFSAKQEEVSAYVEALRRR